MRGQRVFNESADFTCVPSHDHHIISRHLFCCRYIFPTVFQLLWWRFLRGVLYASKKVSLSIALSKTSTPATPLLCSSQHAPVISAGDTNVVPVDGSALARIPAYDEYVLFVVFFRHGKRERVIEPNHPWIPMRVGELRERCT